MHITRGHSRDQRPDLTQGMLDVLVAHQAGIPVLMQPLSGNRSDAQAFGQIVSEPMGQLQPTYGMPCLVADSALYSADHLQQLAETPMTWIPRVPATLSAAQAALAQANPQTMAPVLEGYRYHELTSTYGKVEQRWVRIYSEPRQAQVQRTVDKQRLKHSAQDSKACKKVCGTTCACEADARQALATWERGLQATCLHQTTVRPISRYGKRGRPGPGAPPDQVVYQIDGALASRVAPRQALVDQHSCCILATNELDTTQRPPQEVLAGYKGQGQSERGFRFVNDPQFFASSLSLKKPERIMALLMVMTVCFLVYAA
jgi:transposase